MRRRSLRLLRPNPILNSQVLPSELRMGLGRKQVKRTADFYPKFTIALFTFIISFNIELSSTFA